MSGDHKSGESSRRLLTLIFIVAYQAEKHIVAVLERLPAECLNSPLFHILCIDDSSSDLSAAAAAQWLGDRSIANSTVLRNPMNQGYGGNQKIGYRFALERDFDLVILLHGDGQYAPENIRDFIEAYRDTGAGVILGSRMMTVKSAAQGGMPGYKILGNRLLTKFQNLTTGQSLSEYHTGYRAYSRDFLNSVPFELNTNDFHFDTEILLQAMNVGAQISEFEIPTHYGDEICHVNGLTYAANVVASTLQYRMHHLGMLCSLKYRDTTGARYQDKCQVPFSSHTRALEKVALLKPKTLLDLGCGLGFVASKCEELGIEVTGVDSYEPAEGMMSNFRQWNLDEVPLPFNALEFEAILMLDVIEHLSSPEEFLLGLRNFGEWSGAIDSGPTLILTTPNIAFLAVRLNLLLGRFNYAERGILDITHKRLFTKSALLAVFEECGFHVENFSGVGAPFETIFGGRTGRLLGRCSSILARVWPSLFAFQFLAVCRPLPGLKQLLRSSERYSTGTVSSKPEELRSETG